MRHYVFLILIYYFCVSLSLCANNWRPVVLMHGIIAGSDAMQSVQQWIEADFPGIYVHNMEIGNGKEDSVHMEINHQVDLFAQSVKNDSFLSSGFNLIAHSQGGLITRAYVERYNDPPVYNLISWAGPQNGVFGVPQFNSFCPDADCPWVDWLMDLLLRGPPSVYLQTHYTFAAYWKDIYHYDDYLAENTFLADINNERQTTNATYKKNMLALNSYVLVYSTNDTVIVPRQSPWFYFYEQNDDSSIVPFNKSEQYLENLFSF